MPAEGHNNYSAGLTNGQRRQPAIGGTFYNFKVKDIVNLF